MAYELPVVLNGLLIVASRGTELSHLAQARDRADVPVLQLGLLLYLLLLLLELKQVLVKNVPSVLGTSSACDARVLVAWLLLLGVLLLLGLAVHVGGEMVVDATDARVLTAWVLTVLSQ